MNINCIICSDLFLPRSEIYTTSCGHLFHYVCLIQWIERSKTCPQCRHQETSKTVHRIYFNTQHVDSIPDDAVTLQAKIDNTKFQLSLKHKDLTNYTEKYTKCKSNNYKLQEMLQNSFARKVENDKAMRNCKEQLQFMKDKLREREKVLIDIRKLEEQIKNLSYIRTSINGCEEDVTDILADTNDPKTLCVLVTVLQKELADTDRKANKLFGQCVTNKNDYRNIKGKVEKLRIDNEQLQQKLKGSEKISQKCTELKQQLADLIAKSGRQVNLDDSVNRVIFESPAPRRPDLNEAFEDDNAKESPSIMQRVQEIKNSDSPYLNLKQTGAGYSNFLQAKFTVKTKTNMVTKAASSTDLEKYSLFNKIIPTASNKGEYNYNGLGGHSKEDLFPQPKKAPTTLKRTKSTSSGLSSEKFRKLAPGNSRRLK